MFERLKGDVTTLRGFLRTLKLTTPIAKNPQRVFPDVVADLARTRGDGPALLSAREQFSYRTLGERQNRDARWALGQGIAMGDTVCLLMPNRPECMPVWLGIDPIFFDDAESGAFVGLDRSLFDRIVAGDVRL